MTQKRTSAAIASATSTESATRGGGTSRREALTRLLTSAAALSGLQLVSALTPLVSQEVAPELRASWLSMLQKLLAPQAQAMGRPTQVAIGYLVVPGAEPNPRPGVIETMLFELARNTSVEVRVEAVPLKATDPRLFDFPLVFLLGTQGFPPLPEPDRLALERHLRAGGVLFIDDCSGIEATGPSSFDYSVRREVARLFPRNPMERIREDHVLYRTFFLLRRIVGRVALQSYMEGVELGEEVTPILYSRNDLTGSFARSPGSGYLYECVPGGDVQRVAAYKLGINLLMYALCLNYKHDLTHVRALLKKRRGVFDE